MIMKNLPPPTTSPRTVHPDDVMRGHRDGKNSPQERPRASEKKEKVVVNGTPSTDEGGDFISHIEVETDQEPTQLADRHSELAILWQQGTTAKSTDWGGDCPIQADFVENTNNAVTATRVAAHEEAAIGKHRQGTASTDENKAVRSRRDECCNGSSRSMIKGYCCIGDFLLYVTKRRVTFSRGADARQLVVSSKCFELVFYKQTV
ncbi:unnamed protein product [Ascophyllum nodosum]